MEDRFHDFSPGMQVPLNKIIRRETETDRENSNSKTLIRKDSRERERERFHDFSPGMQESTE